MVQEITHGKWYGSLSHNDIHAYNHTIHSQGTVIKQNKVSASR